VARRILRIARRGSDLEGMIVTIETTCKLQGGDKWQAY
jgi:hypothetical protein